MQIDKADELEAVIEEPEVEQAEEPEVDGEPEGEPEADAEGDEIVVTIGEDSPPQDEEAHSEAPAWVKELRKSHRELQRENRELKAKQAVQVETNPAVQVGEKPTLESCDYDADDYEAKLADWYDKKREYDALVEKKKAEQQAVEAEWNQKVAGYEQAKASLKVADYDDAEAMVQELFNVTQQGILLQGAEKPELLVYALGKNPKKAKELARITDPVKYAFAAAKLEAQLKVSKRNAPAPERTVRGSGGVSGVVDSTLERLRRDAEKTGDYTKVVQYRKSKRG